MPVLAIPPGGKGHFVAKRIPFSIAIESARLSIGLTAAVRILHSKNRLLDLSGHEVWAAVIGLLKCFGLPFLALCCLLEW